MRSGLENSGVVTMPVSGAYQAPGRMSMSTLVPYFNVPIDAIMVESQAWTRTGSEPWRATSGEQPSYASVVGVSYTDWFRTLGDPVVTDLGDTYRVTVGTAPADLARPPATPRRWSAGMPVDVSSGVTHTVLSIDKATNYLTAMQIDLTLPVPDLATNMVVTLHLSFSDFDSAGVDIRPPV